MEIPADQHQSESKRMEPFSDWVKAVKRFARRLAGFLNLTDEDQEKAGIYLGYDK
jgi:hypothetical protein